MVFIKCQNKDGVRQTNSKQNLLTTFQTISFNFLKETNITFKQNIICRKCRNLVTDGYIMKY